MDASDFTREALVGWVAKADRWTGHDRTASHWQRAAQAHIQAGQLWQQAAHAYAGGDSSAAKDLYQQAHDASARAHDYASRATMI